MGACSCGKQCELPPHNYCHGGYCHVATATWLLPRGTATWLPAEGLTPLRAAYSSSLCMTYVAPLVPPTPRLCNQPPPPSD